MVESRVGVGTTISILLPASTEKKIEKKTDRPYDAVILDLTVRGGMGGKETIRKNPRQFTGRPLLNNSQKRNISSTITKAAV
ncbi:MAG: hypothetical protein ACYS0I_12915 [Planctomycetota bacterium]|jgi:hypothetical protein